MQVDTYRPRNKPRQRKQNDRERRGWIMSKHRPDWHCTQYERQVIETAEKTEASSDRRRRSRIRTGSDLDTIPNSWLHDPGHAWQRHVPYTECSSIAVHVSPQHCCCVQSRSSAAGCRSHCVRHLRLTVGGQRQPTALAMGYMKSRRTRRRQNCSAALLISRA